MKKRNSKERRKKFSRRRTHQLWILITWQKQYWSACSQTNWIRSCSRQKFRKSLNVIKSSKKCSKKRKTKSGSSVIIEWVGLCQASTWVQDQESLQSSTRSISRAQLAPQKSASLRDSNDPSQHQGQQWPRKKLRQKTQLWHRVLDFYPLTHSQAQGGISP